MDIGPINENRGQAGHSFDIENGTIALDRKNVWSTTKRMEGQFGLSKSANI